MHVDAFFEYLLENPHPYWTEIPLDSNPISEGGRDGVAAEDDMALRSLLPHIRPRRGRKRPDDEDISRSPSQKPKMEPGSNPSNSHAAEPGVDHPELNFWAAAAQFEAQSGTYLFAQDQFTRMNMHLSTSGPSTGEDFAQTPMTAPPYSAVTPAAAGSYWSEQSGDPKPGMTPTKSKTNRRHGAKVVSSAWRSGGTGGSGKVRGRPPLNRQASQGHSQGEATASPFSSFPSVQSASPPTALAHASLHHSPHVMDAALQQHLMTTPGMNNPAANMNSAQYSQQVMGGIQQAYDVTGQSDAEAQAHRLRQTKSQLSLQVPERTGAEVRLATPQGQQQMPAVMVNGAITSAGDQASIMAHPQHHQSLSTSMAGSDVHMMDPFASAAAQTMYSMLYQQQEVQQQQHHHHHHQHHHQQPRHRNQQQHQQPQQIQHVPQPSRDTAPLYSTPTTSTHHMPTNYQPASPPPTTHFHHATPARLTESASADTQSTGMHSRDASNRTNLDALEALLTHELLGAQWADAQGGQIATCGVDEAGALAREIVENARRAAGSAQGFLMNVAAIAGVTWLKKADGRVRVQRMGLVEGGRREVYDVHWELQLGDVKSGFSLREVVARGMWVGRKGRGEAYAESEEKEGEEEEEEEGEEKEDVERWRRKYHGLLGVVQEQNAELSEFRQGMIDLCRPRSRRREAEGGEMEE